jgi:hypothetical protein
MVVLEFIGELLVMIFVEIIFKGIILRAFNFITKGFSFIWIRITGKAKPEKRK